MTKRQLLTILAREAGYISTADACHRLNMTTTRLLALRRQALEEFLGVEKLPPFNHHVQAPLPMSAMEFDDP